MPPVKAGMHIHPRNAPHLKSLLCLNVGDDFTRLASLVHEQGNLVRLRNHSLEPRSVVVIAGPPGSGKTTIAKALFDDLGVKPTVVFPDSLKILDEYKNSGGFICEDIHRATPQEQYALRNFIRRKDARIVVVLTAEVEPEERVRHQVTPVLLRECDLVVQTKVPIKSQIELFFAKEPDVPADAGRMNAQRLKDKSYRDLHDILVHFRRMRVMSPDVDPSDLFDRAVTDILYGR